jgi:hypothetical protein
VRRSFRGVAATAAVAKNGQSLIDDAALQRRIRTETAAVLQLENV